MGLARPVPPGCQAGLQGGAAVPPLATFLSVADYYADKDHSGRSTLRPVYTSGSSRRPVLEGGGGTWGGFPTKGTPKTRNSTDLTHYFLGWTQIDFRKNGSFFGGANNMMAPFLGFWGHGWFAPPPWIRQCPTARVGGCARALLDL